MRKDREQQRGQNGDNRWHHKEEPCTAPREQHFPEPMIFPGLWIFFAHSQLHETPGFARGLAKFDGSGKVRVALLSGNPIPLTLTLSHGEREQSAAGSIILQVRRPDTALSFAERQRSILPLPKGGGRSEGKREA